MWWSAATGKVETATALDPVGAAASSAVGAVLRPGPVKDALHGRWLGHPVHPLLIALPIGLWSGATLLDLVGERSAARRLVGAGLLAVVPTAASGLADWSELGEAQRPKRVGVAHALWNSVTAAVYLASWRARRRGEHGRGAALALVGAAGLTVGGYLGGHLAYSQAVGVNRNADTSPEPEDWTDVGADSELQDGQPMRVTAADQPVVLVRSQGAVHALGGTCAHWGAPLDEGSVEGDCLVCPWHGSTFRLRDGSVARGPATYPQPVYDVRTVGGRIQVRYRR